MKKHEIEIPGLPEGWEPVAIRKQKLGEHIFCLDTGLVVPADHRTPKAHLIVKKKQPRRIVLEETDEEASCLLDQVFNAGGTRLKFIGAGKIWREVNGNGPALHKQDDKESLRLSVDECKEIGEFIFSHQVNPQLFNKLREFIRSKS